MIDSRVIFVFFADSRTADPIDRPDRPTKNKATKSIVLKVIWVKIRNFENIPQKPSVLAGVLGPKMGQFYGTFHSRFPFT